jgi:hypothetical protein
VTTPAQRSLVEYALAQASGADGGMFAPWSNVRRDHYAACERAKIQR